ncbi:MAG: hypothetical protein KBD24_00760 [Candidatus Pacebacteria bacterium]|nr:hypothetical protein [Candidatus Paceibacterota bacterium]
MATASSKGETYFWALFFLASFISLAYTFYSTVILQDFEVVYSVGIGE